MAGSVGTVKIPIVSTFDASGVAAAKAGLKDLQQSQSGGGGAPRGGNAGGTRSAGSSSGDEGDRVFEQTRTANEKYSYQLAKIEDLHKRGAISSDTYTRARKQASEQLAKSAGTKGSPMAVFKQLAGDAGLPTEMLGKLFSPGTGVAAAAAGAFVAFQKSAMHARELRIESQKLGTTVGFYRDLANNARMAGVSLADVAGGIEKVNSKSAEALTGDIASQAYFAGLGVSPDQLAKMQGDPAALAKLVAQRGNTAEQIQMFGSVDAAKAVAKTSGDSGYGRASNNALEATNLGLLEHPIDALQHGAHSALSGAAYGFQAAARGIATGRGWADVTAEMNAEAAQQEGKERTDRIIAARKQAGSTYGAGLLNTRESMAAESKTEANYNYSDLSALTGVSADTFHARAQTQRMQKRQAFDSQFQNPYERQDAQQAIIQRQEKEGTLTGTQSYRAQWGNFEQTAAAVAGTRSHSENLANTLKVLGAKWSDPGIGEAKLKEHQAEIDAQQQKIDEAKTREEGARSRWAPGFSTVRKATARREAAEQEMTDLKANIAKGGNSVEQRDAARQLIDTISDYAEKLTHAGPLAGAVNMATASGGYEQVVGAQEQMRQSGDQVQMVKMLIDEMKKRDPEKAALYEQSSRNLGYQFGGPFDFLNNIGRR